MIPLHLTLRGFKGIRAGIGLDEVSLDLSNLPEGLIAVFGENGSGKTTILDNLHPYRMMPYKMRDSKAGWTPAAFSYYGQCEGRDAMKELVFEHGGKTYRSLLLIDAEKRKMEAYLYLQDGENWEPLNDGKTKTYDPLVNEVVGSPTLFFTGPFRAQDARKLSSYTRGEILDIIVELLNIDHIKIQGEKAKAVGDTLQSRQGQIQEKIAALEEELKRVDELAEELKAAQEAHGSDKVYHEHLVDEEKAARDKIEVLQGELAEHQAQKQRLQEKKTQLDELSRSRDALEEEWRGTLRELSEEGERILARHGQAEADIETTERGAIQARAKARERFDKEGAEIEAPLSRARKILSGEEQIREKAKEEERITNELAAKKKDLSFNRTNLEKAREELEKSQRISGDLRSIERDIESAEQRSAMLGDLDCRGDGSQWVNEACPLLGDAVKAKSSLEDLRQRRQGLQGELEEVASAAGDVGRLSEAIRILEQSIETLEKDLAEAQSFTKLLPELEQAKERVSELEKRKAALQEDLDADEKDAEDALAKIRERRQTLETQKSEETDRHNQRCRAAEQRHQERKDDIGEKIATLSGEVADLEINLATDPETQISQLRNDLTSIQDRARKAAEKVQDNIANMGRIQGQIDALKSKADSLESLRDEASRIGEEIVNWRVLQKGCSNDGIIALEIDDAGPSIAAMANDLLSACYGSRFSVRLETQSAKADGTLKEDFDITVFDADTGEEKSITDMSGGQVTWIEDAITRAICLFHQQKVETPHEAHFSDEKDGALDPKRKGEFFAIKRRAMERGGYRREFFISQTPELVEQAEACITLEPGRGAVIE